MIVISPSDFARSNRQWKGDLSLNTFPRLYEAVGKLNETVTVQLEFSLDQNGRIRVCGKLRTKAKLRCSICTEERAVPFSVCFDVRLVRSEQEASEIFTEYDSIVLQDDKITIQELIEDDVLMSIPSQVCDGENPCPRRPVTTETIPSTTHRPFANIDQLVKVGK